ncbi:NADPH-dependent diflavin oxidoreductase 1 [Psilocybe cubensis]|uniref:NADPH-dependent diflavin oxidoreductase 1 n=2 Tax=Psilocybe cubensis TaxID=181762 RepID=A0A8H7XMI5_PSICU|nr:NADPH-dependent diflavin oxidoreductase 1 [Psilocybe cubensis]KAH9477144.1 NADPH-dependent diflavin oxidoreductase 1 [Psilocybe cubensis]
MSGSEEEDRSLLVVYATETGNAQDAADYIARQCRRIAFQCRVVNIDSFSLPDLLSEPIVIFVVSTTGSGIEPRSMTPLWTSLLRGDLPSDAFEDLYFSVFGLGDTAYEKFCWAAKKLSRRLESIGGTEFYERGEGDEQHRLGIDGALQPWTEGLIKRLLELVPLPPGLTIQPVQAVPLPRVKVKETSQTALEHSADPLKSDLQYHKAIVKKNERITDPEWYQDVRHFELDFRDNIQYSPGDVAVIHPVALESDVESFLITMGWQNVADEPFEIEQALYDQSLPDHLPPITTLRILFTRFLDFNSVPKRSFFQYLRYFTSDEREQEKLDEFLSPEGSDELYDYCYRVRRTIHEVLTEFRNVKIPKDYIFDVFPPLRPREFSIASSIKVHPHQIHLCIAMVKYRTKLKIPRKGVCTSYLSILKPGDTLLVGVRKGLLRLPGKNDTPVIFVGPGTGIAPMRSAIEQRVANGCHANTLYFGCRSASKDQHYASEWQDYATKQLLTYRTAFSRDGAEGEPRVYVQDLIRRDSERIWDLVGRHKAWVLVSGSSNKMPAAVKDSIAYAMETHGGLSANEAKEYVRLMVKEGRLIEECWS